MRITFAPFLVDLPESAIIEISDLCEFLDVQKVEEISAKQFQYVDALFQSAEIFHSNCKKVVITDTKTKFPENFGYEILRLDVDPSTPNYSRILAYIQFLKQLKKETHVIFPDTDVLFNSNLKQLFENDFDVAMPFRHQHLNMPIICSLMIVHGQKIKEAIRFFETLLNIYEKKYSHFLTWWGDQTSLRDIIDLEKRLDPKMIQKLKTDSMAVVQQDSFRLLLLENEVWNFSPPKEFDENATFPEKKVLHFLGYLRKQNLLSYFENHIKK